MNEWIGIIACDAALVATSVAMLGRRLTLLHPATIYLFFHFYAITLRLWAIAGGSPTMYADYYWTLSYRYVTNDEIVRAVLFADLALAMFTAGVIIAQRSVFANLGKSLGSAINASYVQLISLILFPVGLVVFVMQRSAGEGSMEFFASGYLFTAALWPLNCLCALVFCFGFRLWLMAGVTVLLAIVALQGFHRFMIFLPLLFLVATYLVQSGRRWLPWPLLIGAVAAILVFPQMKYLGPAIANGDTAEVVRILRVVVLREQDINSKDEQFLDQYAGALTMADEKEMLLLGSSYLAVVTLPIPRSWWPNKPGLGDHVIALATPDRPYDVEGRIITYIGEAYLNFGTVGVVLVPLLLGVGLTAWYVKANCGSPKQLARYVYMAFMVSFVQLFRDGLVSLILFGLVFNLPMFAIWALHSMARARDQLRQVIRA